MTGPSAVRADTEAKPKIRVLLVDDHEMIRRGFRDLIAEEPDIEIVGEAATVSEGVSTAAVTRPDVAVLDLRLPDGDGVGLCRSIRSHNPGIQCLLFTTYSLEEAETDAIIGGAAGYLLKSSSSEELVAAIRDAVGGQPLTKAETAGRMALSETKTRSSSPEILASRPITARQLEVLKLAAEGLDTHEIAERLDIATATVAFHLQRVAVRLGAPDRHAAVNEARARGLLDPSDPTAGGTV